MKSTGMKMPKPILNEATDEDKIHYPSITMNSKAMPEMEDYKIGDRVMMKVSAKVKGMCESYNKKGEMQCEMDITGVEVLNKTEDRKKAEHMGMDMKDYKEVTKKLKK